jgi:hypothetical protein
VKIKQGIVIYVFKTSVKTKKAVQQLKPYLNKFLPAIKWNFDLQDCDNILRLDAPVDITVPVMRLLKDKGFRCEELED